MDLSYLVDVILHLDVYLAQWSNAWGLWMYLFLFLIIFAETGLIVTPFLPGDSLLFAVGALTAIDESGLNVYAMALLLMSAAIIGDNLNYRVGFLFGEKAFVDGKSIFFKKKNLDRTHAFYEKYGAITVVIARFMPIVRTFAPFVAGVGKMKYIKFLSYSVFGAVIWINSFLWAGHFFGNLPQVKQNFHFVIFGVIIVSIIPMFWGVAKQVLKKSAFNKSY